MRRAGLPARVPKAALIDLLAEFDVIDSFDVAEAFQVPVRLASSHLSKLCADGLLRRRGRRYSGAKGRPTTIFEVIRPEQRP